MRVSVWMILAVSLLSIVTSLSSSAQDFRTPAPEIVSVLTTPAPAEPLVHVPSRQLALVQSEQVISLQRLLTPRLGLAGMRLDPITRYSSVEPLVLKVDILDLGNPQKSVKRTWNAAGESRLGYVRFSPDGRYLSALQIETGQPTGLWLFEIASGKTRRLTQQINPAWDNPCEWIDAHTLLCQMITDKPLPPAPAAPEAIAVEHQGAPLPTRTYSHLLETSADDALFDYYFSSQLAKIDLSGNITPVNVESGLINQISVAPDGNYLSLRRIVKPYPRLVAAKQFPAVVEVWDLAAGKRLYQSSPMGFGIETELDTGGDPATLVWKPQPPATAGFIYRAQGANGAEEYQWRALPSPFTGEPAILARSPYPIRTFGWSSAGTPWYISGASRQQMDVNVLLPDGNRVLWRGYGSDDHPEPGKALRIQGSSGPVLEDKGSIFIAGNGITADSVRPFVERIDLETGKARRLFTADANVFEPALAILDPASETLLTRRESETIPPGYRLVQGGRSTLIHQTANPYPQLDNVTRRQINYLRDDGVKLTGTLYLPAKTYKRPLPTLIWIYPREYTSNSAAEQVDAKPFRFHHIVGPSPVVPVLAGYAVLVNPTVPIISDQVSDNAEYLPQLISSTKAAVDYLVKEGISDPKRMAIGGRSYGAFSTANLLVHSDLFATGIAMSGAYNRTLTPFGFQHEKRTFWDATDYYTSISPFFFANKVNEPLLLVHGGADPNPGTPKIQARRFFHALVGEGKTVRYVELPGEEHHYRGRETVLHATWEMIDWLDRYLK